MSKGKFESTPWTQKEVIQLVQELSHFNTQERKHRDEESQKEVLANGEIDKKSSKRVPFHFQNSPDKVYQSSLCELGRT